MGRQKISALGLGCLLVLASSARAALFDHSNFDEILHRYVDEEGLVDYDSIRRNSLTALESYFERTADADLNGWPYAERLAFWINVYNARVIDLIAHKTYLKKISQDFEMFNRPFKVAGVMLSLNDIEHRILRGTTNPDNKKGPIRGLTLAKRDPRIHFALVCGAVDCARLRNFAYTAENVDDTLYDNASHFANSSKHVDIVDGKLKLSSLLKWYAKDFADSGGVARYLSGLISPEKRGDAEDIKRLLATDLKKAEYAYDWTINDQKNTSPSNLDNLP